MHHKKRSAPLGNIVNVFIDSGWHAYRKGTARLSQWHSAINCATQLHVQQRCADCGLRTQIRSNCWICGLTANGFFIQRSIDVAITMNSVKILHAVRSAITAIAELLVHLVGFLNFLFVNFLFGYILLVWLLIRFFSYSISFESSLPRNAIFKELFMLWCVERFVNTSRRCLRRSHINQLPSDMLHFPCKIILLSECSWP